MLTVGHHDAACRSELSVDDGLQVKERARMMDRNRSSRNMLELALASEAEVLCTNDTKLKSDFLSKLPGPPKPRRCTRIRRGGRNATPSSMCADAGDGRAQPLALQRPTKRGSRFSTNARNASRESSLPPVREWRSVSSSM